MSSRGSEKERVERALFNAKRVWSKLSATMSASSRSLASLERNRDDLDTLHDELEDAQQVLGSAVLAFVESGGDLVFEGGRITDHLRGRRRSAELVSVSVNRLSEQSRETLRDLLEELGKAQDMDSSEATRAELAALRAATSEESLERWDLLPREIQLSLSHVIVSRARAFQEIRPEHISWCDARDEVADLFARIKPRASRAGFIHGLAVSHSPKHGDDWYADAERWRRELETVLGAGGTATARDEEPPTADLDETIEGAPGPQWGWWPALMGKTLAVLAPTGLSSNARRLAVAFAAKELLWVDGDTFGEAPDRVERGDVDLVVAIQGHGEDDLAESALAEGVTVVTAKSLDVVDVRAAIERGVGKPDA
jgi:hypothetical protein